MAGEYAPTRDSVAQFRIKPRGINQPNVSSLPADNTGDTAYSASAAPTSIDSTTQVSTTTGGGPPLSNPGTTLSDNLALAPPPAAKVSTTGSSSLDPFLIGGWAWIHPQQGIIAFIGVAADSTYTRKSVGNSETSGKVETGNNVLRLVADNTGETEEFDYQPAGPDEINLVGSSGDQTVLLRNKIE